MRTPKPVNKTVVCSECGLPWDKHGEKPTLETCVKLLRAERAWPRPNPFGSGRVGAGVVNPMYPVTR